MKTQHIVLSPIELDGEHIQPAGDGQPAAIVELNAEQAAFLTARGAVSDAVAPSKPAKPAALQVVAEGKA